MTVEQVRAFAEQVHDPQHCHVEVSPGQFIRHSEDAATDHPLDPPAFLKGEKVRFTKLAALHKIYTDPAYKNARMIPI